MSDPVTDQLAALNVTFEIVVPPATLAAHPTAEVVEDLAKPIE